MQPRKVAKRATKSTRHPGPEVQRQKIAEEFAQLDREIENYLPRIRRHEKLRQLILDWYQTLPPEEEITVSGINCEILISARDKVRSVTSRGKTELFKLWGAKGFIARSHVMLKSLPDPKDPEGLYTEQALSGPRHLRVVTRPAAQQSAA